MLIEIEVTNPARPAARFAPIKYTARVWVSPERRKQIIDILFPDRRKPEVRVQRSEVRRCDCENGTCQESHRAGACQSTATVPALYGSLCLECSRWMPAEFLRREA